MLLLQYKTPLLLYALQLYVRTYVEWCVFLLCHRQCRHKLFSTHLDGFLKKFYKNPFQIKQFSWVRNDNTFQRVLPDFTSSKYMYKTVHQFFLMRQKVWTKPNRLVGILKFAVTPLERLKTIPNMGYTLRTELGICQNSDIFFPRKNIPKKCTTLIHSNSNAHIEGVWSIQQILSTSNMSALWCWGCRGFVVVIWCVFIKCI